MSNPSFDNIDKWLFEYMEGNLSPAQISQLETFMLNNPEFERDMDAWQLAKVDATPVEFPGNVGRKRKPVPFWLVSTVVLTGVFIAGSFFGVYVNTNTVSSETLLPESAAQTQDYVLTSAVDLRNRDIVLNSSMVSKSEIESYNETAKSPTFSRSLKGEISNQTVLSNLRSISQVIINQQSDQSTASTKGLLHKTRDVKSELASISVRKDENSTFSSEDFKVSNEEIVPEIGSPVIEETQVANTDQNELAENVANSSEGTREKVQSNKLNVEDEHSAESESTDNTAKMMTRGQERISVDYNKSFSSKVKSTVRKIIRMTENPIALTNSKDIYYHAPNMQTLNVNAATAGNLLRSRFQLTSRAQWTGHSNQQFLNELSYDSYVKSIRGGIGVQMSHGYYGQGTYNVGQLALTYSPKFTVNRNFSIEPAIRLKMGDKRLNAQNLVPGQVIEMERRNEKIFYSETPENPIKDLWYKDVALALSSNTKWFSVGFQMDNIGRHFSNVYNSNESNQRSGIHYTATLGTDFVSRTKIFSLSPYIMCQKVENLSEIWGGSIFRYKKLTMGGGISSSGDYAGSLGVKTNQFMLTYNADMTHSNLIGARTFSQQLTIRILMNNGRYGHRMLKQ